MNIKKQHKKFISSVTVLILMVSTLLSGCKKAPEPIEPGFEIYYVNSSENGLYKVPYELKSDDVKECIDEVTEQLKIQSDKLLYKTVIDNIFMLDSVSIKEDQLYLGFTQEYKNVDPLLEVLCRASLVRTYGQIEGIDGISFTVAGEPLTDQAGNLIGTMTPDMFITNAGNEINAYEKATLTLYFADEDLQKLERTTRTVVYNTNIPLEKLVMDELIKGPGEEDLCPIADPSTKGVSVTVTDGICYVNFTEGYLAGATPVSEDIFVYAITDSLVELNGINKVKITIEGSSSVILTDIEGNGNLYERNLDIVGN
ncbi:MAG: GerMN domain-containing protein [Lachnospiraceae bacterium]|nr:GerMN domain-containing protein [Lachnospiraceae bacterium]